MARRKTKKPHFGQLIALKQKIDRSDRAFSTHLDVDDYRRLQTSLLKRGDEIVDGLVAALSRDEDLWRREAVYLLVRLEVTSKVARALAGVTNSPDPWVQSLACNRLMDHFEMPVAAIVAQLNGEQDA